MAANPTTKDIDIATPGGENGDMPQSKPRYTIQTQVSTRIYRLAEKAAEREGLSVASWMRRMLSLEIDHLIRDGIIVEDASYDA